nr:HIT domain-containing protein [Candidatus Sigynarchaeota archaeon]
MSDCIFCKILDGTIPSRTVFKNENVVAFLDINPATPGHTLVIPRVHFSSMIDGNADLVANVYKGVKDVVMLLKNRLDCSGFNILTNQGKDAGQVIDHFHVHVIPRSKSDKIRFLPPENKLSDTEMDALHKKITK